MSYDSPSYASDGLNPRAVLLEGVGPTGDYTPVKTTAGGALVVSAGSGSAAVAALTGSTVAMTDVRATIVAAGPSRTMLVITNNGPDPVYIGGAAVVKGDAGTDANGGAILLTGQGRQFTIDDLEGAALTIRAWYGVCATGKTATVSVEVGT